jgi:hypothetical protein
MSADLQYELQKHICYSRRFRRTRYWNHCDEKYYKTCCKLLKIMRDMFGYKHECLIIKRASLIMGDVL